MSRRLATWRDQWSNFVFGAAAVLVSGLWLHSRERDRRLLSSVVQSRDSLRLDVRALSTEVRRYRSISRHSMFSAPVLLEGASREDSIVSFRLDRLERPLLVYTFDPSCPA